MSDGVGTATPEAKAWLSKNTPKSYWDATLGKNGGGGFLAGQTVTKIIPKGTRVFRACGNVLDAAGNAVAGARVDGAWWSPAASTDPIRDLALPSNNPATNVVEAELAHDVEVLAGPGAPRCSTKPGGPEQFCLPFEPIKNGMLNVVSVK